MYEYATDLMVTINRIIDKMEDLSHIRDMELKIDCLMYERQKTTRGKEVYADIRKVSGWMSMYCDYDYIITVYEPNIADLTEAQIQIILYHELLHIGHDNRLVDHDVQDFRKILKKYGIDYFDDDIELLVREEEDDDS